MHRSRALIGLAVVVSCIAIAAQASAQQSVTFSVGGLIPRGDDGRGVDDVLFQNEDFLFFDVSDFKGPVVGAEWLIPIGEHVSAGVGAALSSKTVPTVYRRLVNPDDTEIEQDLKLRIAPITATVRFLPLGRNAAVEPYLGAGVGIFVWRYSESGQFVDPADRTIFTDVFTATGTDVGPVIFGGLNVPVGACGVGFEVRYQHGKGNLPADLGFAGSTIDLGGLSLLGTFSVRF